MDPPHRPTEHLWEADRNMKLWPEMKCGAAPDDPAPPYSERIMKMRTQAIAPNFKFPGILACLAVLLAAMPAEARTDSDRSINLAGQQRMLIEQMTAQSVMVAMGIDLDRNMRGLSAARAMFDRTLGALRDGDSELGLSGTSQPEVLTALARVADQWSEFDAVIRDIVALGSVTDDQVRQLTNLNPQLVQATERMVESYELYAFGGQGHSILSLTINVTARQRMLSQRMLRQASLIAYGYRVEQYRAELAQTSDLFGRTLSGLIAGDAELQLIAAPSPEIAAELAKVQRIWLRITPIIQSTMAGDAVGSDPISQVARYTARMGDPLNVAILMYENL